MLAVVVVVEEEEEDQMKEEWRLVFQLIVTFLL